MSKNQVAKQESSQVAMFSTDVPEHLRGKTSSRGSENVGTEDLVIPRLELVQALSPCRKKTDPAYIEGCEEGMLYNNVTRELYGAEVYVIPVYYKKEWLIWKDRKEGGGYRGAFNSEIEAKQEMAVMEDGDKCEAIDTAQHFCLLVDPASGKAEEIVVSMSRTRMKTSRKWNSLIRLNEGDAFSRVYKLAAVSETNANNQDYYNMQVSNVGFASKELYERAEKLYGAIVAGVVKVNRSDDGEGHPESNDF